MVDQLTDKMFGLGLEDRGDDLGFYMGIKTVEELVDGDLKMLVWDYYRNERDMSYCVDDSKVMFCEMDEMINKRPWNVRKEVYIYIMDKVGYHGILEQMKAMMWSIDPDVAIDDRMMAGYLDYYLGYD